MPGLAQQSGTGYTWHFNPQGLSPSTVACRRRALLPHDFTLTSLQECGGLFSVTLSVSRRTAGPHPLDGAVLYVVRIFLTLI